MEEIVTRMATWLKKETEKANATGLLVGVSGGLDSAVVAGLIKRAFPNQSLGVIMPLKSNPMDVHDAEEVIKAFDLDTITIDLSDTHRTMYEEITDSLKRHESWKDTADKITDANLRARLRMSALYSIASQMKYLVVGTDNAAEWHTGYFTKYGDGGVDLQPIIQLTKREVREMADYLNVPTSVIHKEPSADLWSGQTDEEELGTTYQHIDQFLEGKEIPEKDRKVINSLHERTAHKRHIATQFHFR